MTPLLVDSLGRLFDEALAAMFVSSTDSFSLSDCLQRDGLRRPYCPLSRVAAIESAVLMGGPSPALSDEYSGPKCTRDGVVEVLL